ncbi:MAG TPA: hypothetical protein VFW19_15365 [Allosphingosinicella sp.]|nr:hypothetical protein [Allosphingosinicella sp.]
MEIARTGPLTAGGRAARIALYAAWFALALFLVLRHVFWRDEVRALSIALAGDSVPAMLRVLHGEGHPALWYLMLRGAHAIVPVRQVLPAVGFAVGAAAMAILAWRAPFRPWLVALILFGAFGLYEYAVVARNYGIAMLVLFALAAVYRRWRDRGIAIGLILFLLCNTNVPAALLAACFLLFWLVELVGEEGLRWHRKYGLFLLNSAVAAIGALVAFLTVYPPIHDAAVTRFPGGITPAIVLKSLTTPAYSFWDLMPPFVHGGPVPAALLSILLIGAIVALVRTPGGFLAGLAAFLGFEAFFQLVYPGYYRHEALLLVFFLILHWLAAEGRGGRWPENWRIGQVFGRVADAGLAMFVILLALQLFTSFGLVAADLAGIPYSRARDLAALLARNRLTNAVLIADPDTDLEAVPYYANNPLYQMRAQAFSHVVRFTLHGRLHLSLDDYLADGRRLQASGRPVVVILHARLPDRPVGFHVHEANIWNLSGTPDQMRRFAAATTRLARFAPAVTDESYDVYLLNPPTAH